MRRPTATFVLMAAAVLVALCTSAARAVVTYSDIVARYQLSGDPNDTSGHSRHGINSGATFVVDGVRGTVASFNGINNSVNVGSSFYSITESPNLQFALSFWMKPTPRDDYFPGGAVDVNPVLGATSSGVIEIVGQGSWSGMGSQTGNPIGVNSGGGAGSAARVPAINVYDGNWHHVFMQWVDPDGSIAGNTGADATVYVDGILAGDTNSNTYSGNGQTAPNMVLGGPLVWSNGGAADKYYSGLLSDVVFYNRQLTPAEVAETLTLASLPAPPLTQPLLHWKLNDAGGPGIKEEITGTTNVAASVGPVGFGAPGIATGGGSSIDFELGSAPDYIDAGTVRPDGTYVPGSDPSFRTLTETFTVAAWVRLESNSGQDRVIFSSDFTSNDGLLFFTRDSSGANNLGADFGNERRFSGIQLALDTDYFVALVFTDNQTGAEAHFAVWDGSTWTYADASTGKNAVRLQGLEIGSFGTGTRGFDGLIDDVRLYDVSLSDAELDLIVHPRVDEVGPIPEPATASLGLITLAGLALRRKRR